MHLAYFLIFFLCLNNVSSGKLPSYFKKCEKKDPNFNECFRLAINDGVQQFIKPIRKFGTPSLDPLELPELELKAGNGPTSLNQKLKNVKIHGFSKMNCSSTILDFEQRILTCDCYYDNLTMEADYTIHGKVLVLDVFGEGQLINSLERFQSHIVYKLNKYEKNGEEYLKAVDCHITTDPGHMTVHYDNLFNNDKVLGDNINKVLNDNWKEVYGDVKQQFENTFAKIAKTVFNNVFDKVSVKELFGDE